MTFYDESNVTEDEGMCKVKSENHTLEREVQGKQLIRY